MNRETIERISKQLQEKAPPPGVGKLWMNETTVEALRRECKPNPDPSAVPQLTGIPVYIDNSIPDYQFETDEERNQRIFNQYFFE